MRHHYGASKPAQPVHVQQRRAAEIALAEAHGAQVYPAEGEVVFFRWNFHQFCAALAAAEPTNSKGAEQAAETPEVAVWLRGDLHNPEHAWGPRRPEGDRWVAFCQLEPQPGDGAGPRESVTTSKKAPFGYVRKKDVDEGHGAMWLQRAKDHVDGSYYDFPVYASHQPPDRPAAVADEARDAWILRSLRKWADETPANDAWSRGYEAAKKYAREELDAAIASTSPDGSAP